LSRNIIVLSSQITKDILGKRVILKHENIFKLKKEAPPPTLNSTYTLKII
jgi:hypothetical protein